MRVRPNLPGGRLVGLLDVLLALWVVLWIVLALAIAHEVRNLGRLSTTGERVGTAAVRVGESLEKLSSVPLVGDRVAGAGSEVRAAGSRAVSGAHAADRSVDRLSVLLGLSIAVLPTAPLLVYVPLRIERAREARALRRALAAGQGRDALRAPAGRARGRQPVLRAATPCQRSPLARPGGAMLCAARAG